MAVEAERGGLLGAVVGLVFAVVSGIGMPAHAVSTVTLGLCAIRTMAQSKVS